MEISGASIDTKELSTRKVIELKIDNSFLSNGDTDNDDRDANDPFCIKPSKGLGNGDCGRSEMENGNIEASPPADKDRDNKSREFSSKDDQSLKDNVNSSNDVKDGSKDSDDLNDNGDRACKTKEASYPKNDVKDDTSCVSNDGQSSESKEKEELSGDVNQGGSELIDNVSSDFKTSEDIKPPPEEQAISSNESSMDSEILKDGNNSKDDGLSECNSNSEMSKDVTEEVCDHNKGDNSLDKMSSEDKSEPSSVENDADVAKQQCDDKKVENVIGKDSDSSKEEKLEAVSDSKPEDLESVPETSSSEKKETDLNSEVNNSNQNTATSENKEIKINATSENKEIKINATSENKEKEINATSENEEMEVNATSENEEMEVDATSENKEKKINATSENKEVEINATSKNKEMKVDSEERKTLDSSITSETKSSLKDSSESVSASKTDESSSEVSKEDSKDTPDKLEESDKNNSAKLSDTDKTHSNDEKVEKVQGSEEGTEKQKAEGSVGKSVEKVTDIDGSEILITINEVESDKEEEAEQKTKEKKAEVTRKEKRQTNSAEKDSSEPKIKSIFENDVVIVDLSGSPKEKDKPAFPPISKPPEKKNLQFHASNKQPQVSLMQKAPYTLSAAASAPYLHVTGAGNSVQPPTGSVQYVQKVIMGSDGKKQYVNVPVSSYSSASGGRSIYSNMLTQAVNSAKQSQQAAPVSASTASSQNSSAPAQNSASKKEEDDIPLASWEQIDLIKYEIMTKKYDNTFWAGQCPVNKKVPLSEPTKFLFDLGSDLVKQSAYEQITHVQGRKNEAGKLGDLEKENLEKMKKVVEELKEKLKHLELKMKTCDGCNFMTESENIMRFHKEHPHMDPPLDPFGNMLCSMKDCEFETRNLDSFAFHMEAEHRMKARVYDKPEFFQCSLCYFEGKTKNQLTKHKFKCSKNFKPNQNLSPHYPDVNFCLKNIFYKYQIKKQAPAKPPVQPPVKQAPPKPVKPAELYRPPIIRPKTGLVTPNMPYMAPQRNILVTAPQSAAIGAPQRQFVLQNQQLTQYSSSAPSVSRLQGVQIINRTATPAKPGQKPTVSELLKFSQPNVNQSSTQNQKIPIQRQQQQQMQQQQLQHQHLMPQSIAPKPAGSGFEVCEICGGYVKDKMSLRIHFYYAHKVDLPATIFSRSVPPLICEVCRSRFWTTQGLSKHKQSLRHYNTNTTPSTPQPHIQRAMKCWICSRQPDNLYSHLHKFHRLSTSECMALRRCMFCGIQSNTRKDLEIHMASAHGVLIKGEQQPAKPAPPPPVQSSTGLVRNNFCVFCSKQFHDNTQLTLHCLRDHATCSGCGMVVSKATDLVNHVCKVTATRKCSICGIKNLKVQYLTKHLLTHMKKCSVKLKRLTDQDIEIGMGKKRKIEMDLQNQKEVFTKMEEEIWNEIESRRKRDQEEEEKKKDPVGYKRKIEEEEDEKIQQKQQKLEDKDQDFNPESSGKEKGVVVLDD